MTRYEYTELKADECTANAIVKAMEGDNLLAQFYKNCAKGFRRRLRTMTVLEAGQEVNENGEPV